MNKAFNAITSSMKTWGPSKYAAAGAAVGGLYGGVTGENAGSGAMRGAIAGAAVGAGASWGVKRWGNIKDTYGFHKASSATKAEAMGDVMGAAAGVLKNPNSSIELAQAGVKLNSSKAIKEIRGVQSKNTAAFRKISQNGTAMDRAVFIAGSIGEAALDSVSSHLTTPAINTIKSTMKGNFKNISGSDMLATAVTGYGAYEAGVVGKNIADGDYGSATTGMMKMAALKYGYIGGQNMYKGIQAARAAGITGKQAFNFAKQAGVGFHKAVKDKGGYFQVGKDASKAGIDVAKGTGEWVKQGTINGARI